MSAHEPKPLEVLQTGKYAQQCLERCGAMVMGRTSDFIREKPSSNHVVVVLKFVHSTLLQFTQLCKSPDLVVVIRCTNRFRALIAVWLSVSRRHKEMVFS